MVHTKIKGKLKASEQCIIRLCIDIYDTINRKLIYLTTVKLLIINIAKL